MRVWGFVFLVLVLTNGAAAQVSPEARVLVLDRNALKADDPALDNSFEIALRNVETQLMAQHGANVILDKSATAAIPGSIDATAEAAVALAHAEPGWSPRLPVPPRRVAGSIEPTRALVVDMAFLAAHGATSDPVLSQTLDRIAQSRRADLILRRDIVMIGAPGFDTTTLAVGASNTLQKTGISSVDRGMDAPVARILILDRQGLLQNSAVGRDIAVQIRALTDSAKNDFLPESQSLTKEGEVLKTQAAILELDEKERRILDFNQRRDAFAQKIRDRQNQLRLGVALAQRHVEGVAAPIVQQMVKEYGANLVLDRPAVVVGENSLDITSLAITKLDAALQHVDVVLSPERVK